MLGLLFEYERYKHDAVVRVYADDRLVDEISLSKDIKVKVFNYAGMPNSFIGPLNRSKIDIRPEKMFMFEIDEQYLHSRIRIEILNNYNNYSNGFVTKFSKIRLFGILLFPKCLFDDKNWDRVYKRQGNQDAYSSGSTPFPWWGPHHEEVVLRPYGLKQGEDWLHYTLGGNWSLEFPISRKFGLIHPSRRPPRRIYLDGLLRRVLWGFGLLNISDEDK